MTNQTPNVIDQTDEGPPQSVAARAGNAPVVSEDSSTAEKTEALRKFIMQTVDQSLGDVAEYVVGQVMQKMKTSGPDGVPMVQIPLKNMQLFVHNLKHIRAENKPNAYKLAEGFQLFIDVFVDMLPPEARKPLARRVAAIVPPPPVKPIVLSTDGPEATPMQPRSANRVASPTNPNQGVEVQVISKPTVLAIDRPISLGEQDRQPVAAADGGITGQDALRALEAVGFDGAEITEPTGMGGAPAK